MPAPDFAKRAAQLAGARCDICPANKAPCVPRALAKEPVRLIVVGEGPGQKEEQLRAPFMGLSGKFLNERLRADAQIPRAACHLTNAALCRAETDKDNEKAAECCAPRLLREVSELDASVPIAALGGAATKTLLGRGNILFSRGFVWRAPTIAEQRVKAAKKSPLKQETLRGRQAIAGRVILPTLHPAFILRADTWKPVSQLDWKRIGRAVRGELPAPLEDDASAQTVIGGPEVLEEIQGADVSLDIETDGKDPYTCGITLVQVADAERVALLWPWHDSYGARLAAFLGSRRQVVGWNIVSFDLTVLEAHGVVW